MNNMWKKAVLLGVAGYVLGVLIGVIVILTGLSDAGHASVPYVLLCGIPGCITMGSTVIYDVEKWSLVRATATHFAVCFVTYYALAFLMGWLRFGDRLFWIITAAMVVGYVIIWLVMYLTYKRQIRKMNEELKRLRYKEKKD